MDITLQPSNLFGSVTVPPSKSMAHRMLICAVFGDGPTTLICSETNEDIDATADCLRALGANIQRQQNGFRIQPIGCIPESATLACRESGSTLRFLLPIVGALGVNTTILMEGRLPQRPLSPLWEEMERMGCRLIRIDENKIQCTGKLLPGEYHIDGSVSSQFISGLMMALPLIAGKTILQIIGNIQSTPYIRMTQSVLDQFSGTHPEQMTVEGDWSSAAFWMAANALGCRIDVKGVNPSSFQGDMEIAHLLPKLGEPMTISAKDIPDLIPILSVVAAANKGAVFTDIARLRYKESDRVAAIVAMLECLGGQAKATENTLTVHGTPLRGGIVNSFGDHRITMSAAIAATVCDTPVTILGADCVKKSYPKFWEDYAHLGGNYEELLR